jgi:hypothetical protein
MKKKGQTKFHPYTIVVLSMFYSLIMWLILQVNQYFETSVPNNWVAETNQPSHWEVS